MITEKKVTSVACDRCQAEIPDRDASMTIMGDKWQKALELFRAAVKGSVNNNDLCSRCVTRINALAEQIRTRPRRKTKAWSESVPQGPDAEKVKT